MYVKISPTSIKLKTYFIEILRPLGVSSVDIQCENQKHRGDIYILPQQVDAIFGHDWLKLFDFTWKSIYGVDLNVDVGQNKNNLLVPIRKDFVNVLTPKLGKIPNFPYSIKLKDQNVRPIFIKPRPLPYSLRQKVEELKRWKHLAVIDKVVLSSWGTPVVPIVNKDGSIRSCKNYTKLLSQRNST